MKGMYKSKHKTAKKTSTKGYGSARKVTAKPKKKMKY